jgi:hypothetical protein
MLFMKYFLPFRLNRFFLVFISIFNPIWKFGQDRKFKKVLDSKSIGSYFYLFIVFLFTFETFSIKSQIDNTGCVSANVGIDADVYSGALPFGDHSGASPIGTDDWFAGSTGNGIISVTNQAAIQALLQGTGDPTYEARMNAFFGAVVGGNTWYDAVFARDNFGGTGFVDPTAFPVSSKNTQPPPAWSAGPANVLGKNDLLDIAAHVRRNGTSNTSDLYLSGLISRAEPGGAAYMDMEFFIENVTYTAGTGFSYAGPDLGHTSFRFDAAGNLTQMGDILINISLISGGTQPDLQMRLWVKRSDRENPALIPQTFNWGPEYDGPTTTSEYVYASILPKTTGNACGYVNLATELPTAPPWGHKGTNNNVYTTSYQPYALAEFGINLTKFGIDHAFIPGYDPCIYPHNSFCVKTRTSSAFTAALKDFAGPYEWGQSRPAIASGGSLSCLNPQTALSANPPRTDVTYSWTTTNGNIVGPTTGSSITVNAVGDYVLTTVLQNGCNLEPSTYTVIFDPTKPFFGPTTITPNISCSGSNGSISLTASGATTPYTYSWTGPSGYNSTSEDPIGLAPGAYNVTITDANGCTTTASTNVPAGTPVVYNPTISNIPCAGLTNGGIALNPTGSSPFTYSWSNGQTVQNLQNVAAGSYTVTIIDGNGCSWSQPFTVSQPTALSATISKVNDTDPSPTVGNGTIDLTVSGGTAPFGYSWTGPSGFTASTQDLSGLEYGSYSVTVTDANGCTTTASAFIYSPEICNDGIDNNGNGLTDCADASPCVPNNPGTITPSVDPPCINQSVTYTVTNVPGLTYVWTIPAGTSFTPSTTNSITVTWLTTQGGNICVQANNVGCLSTPSCISVTPQTNPASPTPINVTNN